MLDGSGSEVAVPEGAEVTFEYTEMLNGGVAPRAFSLADDGTPRELETTQGANYVEGMMFDVAAHGADPACVAFVDTTGLEERPSAPQVQARSYTWYGADAATTVEMGRVTVEGADLSALPDPDSTGACAEATRLEAGDPAMTRSRPPWPRGGRATRRCPGLLVQGARRLRLGGRRPRGRGGDLRVHRDAQRRRRPQGVLAGRRRTLRELETTQGANYVEGMMFDVAAHGADPACVAFVDTTGLEERPSAPQVQARSYTWYGADAATTVEMGRVTVEGADLSALPDPDSTGACAEATRLEAGDPAYDKVAAAVAKRWSGDPALLRVYSFRVLDGSGSEVAVPEGAEVTFEYTEMLNGGVAPRAFSLADDGRSASSRPRRAPTTSRA